MRCPALKTVAFVAAVAGMMKLPEYFWKTTRFCPVFPIRKVDFGQAVFKPIPGIKVTRDHPSIIQA
jgi:hypothetical protein